MTACSKQAVPTAIPEDKSGQVSVTSVEDWLLNWDTVCPPIVREAINGEFQLDEAKLHKAIAEYKLGHLPYLGVKVHLW